MYSLLPILVFLATANAAAIDRTGAQNAAVEKRLFGDCLFGITLLGDCKPAPAASSSSSSSKAATATSSSSSSSSSAKASTSSSSSASSSSSSSSSSAAATTTAKASASASTTSAAGNIVSSVVAVPSAVVSVAVSIIDCPLGVVLQGVCTQTATSSAAATTTAKASASASSSSAAGNVVSSIVAIPSAVVSQAVSVVAPVASVASSVVAPVASAASSVVAPVASAASSVVAPVVSAASSVVAPVASVVVPVASAASSVVAPVVSAASSVVAPVVSVVSSVIAPASSSASSIIASVSASSAAASSSAVVVPSSSVAPTTTSTSTTPSASATPVNPSVSGWTYQGVVAEGTSGRALTGSTYAGSSMTVESCLAFCDNAGFPLAGLEYSSECYCGSTLSNGASLTKTATGGMACSGNPNEICGGSSALSLYRSTKSNGNGLNSDLTSKTTALPAGWTSTTCMQEVSGRAFTKKSTASDSMTIGQCVSFCGDSKYAALEYGRECYCADTLSNGASLTSTSGQCVTPCAGDASTTCGGPNALQVYTNGNFKGSSSGAYTNTGCVQEVDGRLLRGASIAADNMTIETCTSFCQSQSMSIAGLEYGRECYCSNSYVSTPLQSGQCNMPCAGDSSENCGGPNALNIFTLGA